MGKKSRLKKERREMSVSSEDSQPSTPKNIESKRSTGILIQGGHSNIAHSNHVRGFDDGIVIKDSPFSSAYNNTIESKEAMQITSELKQFEASIRENIKHLKLSPESIQDLEADLETIKAHLKSNSPKKATISHFLHSMLRILEGAAGSAAGQTLISQANKILSLFGG